MRDLPALAEVAEEADRNLRSGALYHSNLRRQYPVGARC